jgi:pyrroloquinoline quinone (PQQ) biosynthesis protein C
MQPVLSSLHSLQKYYPSIPDKIIQYLDRRYSYDNQKIWKFAANVSMVATEYESILWYGN